MWVCRVGLGYVLGGWLDFGVVGVYLAHMVDWMARSVGFLIRYRGTKWQHAALQ